MSAAVGVMHEPVEAVMALPDGNLEGVEGQVGAEVVGDLPADDPAVEGVDDEVA